MTASLSGYFVFNVLYLLLFVLIFIVGIVFYMTDRKRIARKIIAYPYTVLGILGVIFFSEVGIVSNIIGFAIFFSLLYIIILFSGIYAMRWKPTLEKQRNN
ncbi:MAG: hypothetical protein ACYDAP_10390 [Thermoplasmataceae archaeon]|jgi:hypothetical protein